MDVKKEQIYQQLGEQVLYNGADNLIFTIMFVMVILYLVSFKYKKLSFEYMKRVVTIITICFTLSFSYVFYIEDNKIMLSKEIRELELKKIESKNKDIAIKIDEHIAILNETSKNISNSIDSVTKTVQGFSYIFIILLMILFSFEFLIRIKPHITPNFLKKNIKTPISWRDKRKQSFYYKKR